MSYEKDIVFYKLEDLRTDKEILKIQISEYAKAAQRIENQLLQLEADKEKIRLEINNRLDRCQRITEEIDYITFLQAGI